MSLWDKIGTVILVFPMEEVENPMEFKLEMDQVFGKQSRSEIVLISKHSLKNQQLRELKGVTYVSEKDFNFFGKLKNENLQELLRKPFNSLFLSGTLTKQFEKLFSKSRIQHFIGLNSENKFIEINLQPKSSIPSEMVNFAKNTLSKITDK